METRMLDVDEDVAYQLPHAPLWSPDGQHLVYIEQSPTDPFSTIWLADANALASGTVETADGHVVLQGNGRQITDQVEGLSNAAWSPDGSKLALTLGHEDPNRSAVAIFDLATESLTPLVTLADLKTRVRSGGALLLFRGYDQTELTVEPLVRLSVNGWAADGRRLLVTAKGESEWRTREGPTALILVPLDGGPPRLLAYAQSGAAYGVSWSPTNADQFTVACQSGFEPNPRGFLFDLGSGLLYTAAESWNAAWSPDGAWAAFAGQNQVTIVDQEGRPRSILRPHNFCSLPAWNTTTKITLPDATCSLGLDLRIDDQDVYQVGDDLLIRVQNGGDQPVKNVPARVVDGAGNISEPMGLGPLPACGSLLMRIATRDWTSPLTVILNSPEDPSILTEGDHSNNQVTVTLD